MEERIADNDARTRLIGITSAAVAGVVVLVIGFVVGLGVWSVLVALAVGVAVAVTLPAVAERLVAAAVGGEPLSEEEAPRIHNVLDGLCVSAGMVKPEVVLRPDAGANAGAYGVGPERATLVVTKGLVDDTSRIEMEAVIAHLLGAVRRHDTRMLTVAAATVGLPILLADLGRRSALARVVAVVLRPFHGLSARGMAGLSDEGRVFVADAEAAALTRYPPGLVSALQTTSRTGTAVDGGAGATGQLWLAAPVTDSARLRVHPATELRIAALREL